MLRKTSSWVAMAAVILAPMGSASAQGLPPEDGGFEIETEESVKQPGFLENLSQYVGATAGATSGSSNAVDKSLQAMNIQVDVPMPRGFKAAFSVDVGNYENTYKLELQNTRTLTECQDDWPFPQSSQQPPVWQGSPGNEPDDDIFDAPDGYYSENFEGPPYYETTPYYQGLSQSDQQAVQTYDQDRNNYNRYQDCEDFRDSSSATGWSPEEKEILVEDSFSEVGEAFIQWEPTSFITLQAGRQPIVLGQFEAFSPLMFLTPMKSTGTKTRTAKADLSYAQDGVNISLFPTSNIELSHVAVGKMRMDKSNLQRLKQFADEDAGEIKFVNDVDPNSSVEEVDEHELSVSRLMYYGDRLTVGLTAIEGADTSMNLIRDAEIQPFDGGFALGNDNGLRFPEMSASAFEMSFRVSSKWTFTLEYTEQETEVQYNELPNERTYDDADWEPYYQRVVDNLDGKTFIDMNVTMASAGMVFKGDRWLANLQLAQRTEEGATAEEDDLFNKLNYEFIQDGSVEEFNDILPILNVARLLGEEKQGYAGAGFGVFAQSFGFGLTAGWRYFEKLEVGAFMGMALEVTGADTIEQQGYESPEGESFVNFGINYLF